MVLEAILAGVLVLITGFALGVLAMGWATAQSVNDDPDWWLEKAQAAKYRKWHRQDYTRR